MTGEARLAISLVPQILVFLSLIPFLIKKVEIEKEKILFVLFISFSSIMEIVADTFSMQGLNNYVFGHIYRAGEFFFFFFLLLQGEKKYRVFWLAAGLVMGVFVLIDNFWITPFTQFTSSSTSAQSVFLFVFSSKKIITITTKNFIPFHKDERFYMVTGIFIYTGITALMFIIPGFVFQILPMWIYFFVANGTNFFFLASMVVYYKRRKMLAEALK